MTSSDRRVDFPLLAVPHAKVVRGFSNFAVSFVYVVFEDGTDLYWARSRVLEYLNFAAKRLPQGAVTIVISAWWLPSWCSEGQPSTASQLCRQRLFEP